MNYFPTIKSVNRVAGAALGDKHMVVFLDHIVPAGRIEYAFILVVYENATQKPCYFVASEVNSMAKTFGGGSHFLEVFPGDGHVNMGDSDEWGDAKKFMAKALAIVAEHFGAAVPNVG